MKKVIVTNKSIERVGLPKDYKSAICQYIWNGFEAGANEVNITYKINKLGSINSFSISDNGEGIAYEQLGETFGVLLDSKKKNRKELSAVHGGKGVGRLSFGLFASKAEWQTVYSIGKKKYSHTVSIEADQKDGYDEVKKPTETSKKTGTVVNFLGIGSLSGEHIESEEFQEYLRYEFCWFLFLNKANNIKLKINGKELEYESVIADSESKKLKIEKGKESASFKYTYIRWNAKVSEDSYYHYLSSSLVESYRMHTSFNKSGGGAYGFIHSVYIESPFFDDFSYSDNKDPSQPSILGKKDQHHPLFRELNKKLNEILTQKRKEFYRASADQIVSDFEEKEVFPVFENNKYEQERKKDLEEVVKEIYVVEPQIFVNLKPQQEKAILGMLNLLLDTDERENLLIILDSIVGDLKKEEREQIANILKKTTFSNIVRTLKLIESRYECVEILKTLVYDLKKFTNERDHIQKVIESNYWLFGEQFRLVSADQSFETMLNNYLALFDEGKTPKKDERVSDKDSVRRPDIFLCRKNVVPTQDMNDEIEQNILVELKRPSVNIGMTQYRQIEDYMNFILKHEQFNTQLQNWKFFIVGNELSEEVRAKYDSFKDRGKRFLVNQTGQLEIYAMTWADLFKYFEIQHRYLFEKLSYDKGALKEELELKGINLSKESSTKLTNAVSKK